MIDSDIGTWLRGVTEMHRAESCQIMVIGTSPVARQVIYGAAEQLFGRRVGVAQIVQAGLWPDVLSYAIEAAEAPGL